VRGDGGGRSAIRTRRRWKKKKKSIRWRGVQIARESFRTTSYVLSYGSLARDCATGANPGRHQPSYGSVSLRVSTPPRYPRSVSVFLFCSLSLSISLSLLFCTLRHPTTFIPTWMTSVTIKSDVHMHNVNYTNCTRDIPINIQINKYTHIYIYIYICFLNCTTLYIYMYIYTKCIKNNKKGTWKILIHTHTHTHTHTLQKENISLFLNSISKFFKFLFCYLLYILYIYI